MSLPATNFSRSTTFELSTSKRLQLLVGEGEELAAAVFVSFDDPALLDLLAGSRIMRAERDAGGGGALLSIRGGTIGAEPRYRSLRTLLLATPTRQDVLVHIGWRRLPDLVQANGFRAC